MCVFCLLICLFVCVRVRMSICVCQSVSAFVCVDSHIIPIFSFPPVHMESSLHSKIIINSFSRFFSYQDSTRSAEHDLLTSIGPEVTERST